MAIINILILSVQGQNSVGWPDPFSPQVSVQIQLSSSRREIYMKLFYKYMVIFFNF